MKNYPYTLPLEPLLLEVIDKNDNPFMVLPQKQIIQQKLPHRKVYLILYDGQRRVLLQHFRKSETLDLPITDVYAGEAREYANNRLQNALFNTKIELEFEQFTLKEYQHSTFFVCTIDEASKKRLNSSLLWLDFVELQGFVTHFKDMLGSNILELTTNGTLEYLSDLN